MIYRWVIWTPQVQQQNKLNCRLQHILVVFFFLDVHDYINKQLLMHSSVLDWSRRFVNWHCCGDPTGSTGDRLNSTSAERCVNIWEIQFIPWCCCCFSPVCLLHHKDMSGNLAQRLWTTCSLERPQTLTYIIIIIFCPLQSEGFCLVV